MKRIMVTHSIKRETRILALMAASCMFLSMIEYLIPKPLPFMRVGLANLPILLALNIFPAKTIIFLIILKVVGQGLVNGTLFSYIFLFSAVGSFSSGIVMLTMSRIFRQHVSMVGICVLGALSSNMMQLLIAREIIFGKSAILIGPPFLLIGTVSAIIMGLFAEEFSEKSEWFKLIRTEVFNAEN